MSCRVRAPATIVHKTPNRSGNVSAPWARLRPPPEPGGEQWVDGRHLAQAVGEPQCPFPGPFFAGAPLSGDGRGLHRASFSARRCDLDDGHSFAAEQCVNGGDHRPFCDRPADGAASRNRCVIPGWWDKVGVAGEPWPERTILERGGVARSFGVSRFSFP